MTRDERIVFTVLHINTSIVVRLFRPYYPHHERQARKTKEKIAANR